MDIEIKADVIMKKPLTRIRKSVEERFEEFYGTDFESAIQSNPYDVEIINWGKPEGEEVW